MFPPIGFLLSALNMAIPSTCATTWFVITTATPNYSKVNEESCQSYFCRSFPILACQPTQELSQNFKKVTHLVGKALKVPQEASHMHLTSRELASSREICAVQRCCTVDN